jgi:restriction endonuclease Mrr
VSNSRKPPPTQVIVQWVIDDAIEINERLDTLCIRVLEKRLTGWSKDEVAELAETESKGYLPEALRDEYAKRVDDGGTPFFEIDENNPPYIRKAENILFAVSKKLRQMDGKAFEHLCGQILTKLGGHSKITGKSNDGGVDFYATGIKSHSKDLPLPPNAALCVIGQAKCHKDQWVSESEIRKFVGGALLKHEELKRDQGLGLFGPTIFAFWTSSMLHDGARAFAKAMGIWYMDGITFAQYIQELGLEASLPDINS